jgi:hypothetical protein
MRASVTLRELAAGILVVGLGLLGLALVLAGCGTHLTSTDVRAEAVTRELATAGYQDHPEGFDRVRYQAIACNSAGILARAHADAGAVNVPCPRSAP